MSRIDRCEPDVVFVKLGGSLITDKGRPYTPRTAVIARLAREVRMCLDQQAGLGLLLGHGSGSFGHRAAEPYATREGVATPAEWRGFAEVARAAARLNRIVTDAFLEAGVPVLSLQPSASARCRDGELVGLSVDPIRRSLEHGLVPMVYGDVAMDDLRGGTIASTEQLFVHLAHHLRPSRILLLSQVRGVLDNHGRIVRKITPRTHSQWRDALSSSRTVDVTGGMADKVERMVKLVTQEPKIRVRVLTGDEPGLLTRVILGQELEAGTAIRSG
ncbi:MAG: isopentenyl phosphate kinase [Chloroflexota bacterium]